MQFFFSLLAGGMLFLACLTLTFPDSLVAFNLSAYLSGALAVGALVAYINNPTRLRISWGLGMTLSLGYCLSTALIMLINGAADPMQAVEFDRFKIATSVADFSYAMAYVQIAVASLFLVGRFEHGIDTSSWRSGADSPAVETVIWVGLLAAFYGVATSQIGYMGGGQSASAMLLKNLVPAMIPLSILGYLAKRKLRLLIPMIAFIGIASIVGRQYLMYSCVLGALAVSIYGYRITARTALLATIGVISVVMFFYGAFLFFMAIRIASYSLADGTSTIERVSAAISLLTSSEGERVTRALAENVSSRPYILKYFAGMIGNSSMEFPLMGFELKYALVAVTPSVLLPGKALLITQASEPYIHSLRAIPQFDGANSVLTAGYNDFGVAGIILYPIGIALMFSVYLRLLAHFLAERLQGVLVVIVMITLFAIMSAEASLTAYFVNVRNGLLIAILFSSISLHGSRKQVAPDLSYRS